MKEVRIRDNNSIAIHIIEYVDNAVNNDPKLLRLMRDLYKEQDALRLNKNQLKYMYERCVKADQERLSVLV